MSTTSDTPAVGPARNPLLTPEDVEALERSAAQTRKENALVRKVRRLENTLSARRSLKNIGQEIRHGRHLRSWMLAYAEWLVTSPEPPSRAGRLAQARALAKTAVSGGQIRVLEERPDFVAYVDEIQRGPMALARAKYIARIPKLIDGIDEAFDKAKKAGDYKAMAQIAEPALERVLPKQRDAAPPTAITIVLTPAQQRGLEQDGYAVEVLEAEVLDDGVPET